MSRTAVLWDEWADEDWFTDPLAPSAGGSPSNSVTFPTTRLGCKVLIALGADLTQPWYTWSWTDITQWVRFEAGISVTQGRQDETSVVQYGRGQLSLDNRDGRFGRRNPNGPYYGLLSINTPIWGTIDPGSGVVSRLQQFVAEWPTRWDISGKDSTVPIQTAGVLRRLAQVDISKSALRRSILASNPTAYWPLEDGSTSTSAGSGLNGGSTLISSGSGSVVFAGATPPGGSSEAPDLTNSGRLSGALPANTSTGWTVEFAAKCAVSDSDIILEVRVTGSNFPVWLVFPQTVSGSVGAGANIRGGIAGPVYQAYAPSISNFDGVWHHYRVTARQSGSDVLVSFYLDGVVATTTMTGETVGTLSSVVVNSDYFSLGTSIDGSVCHVAFYDGVMATNHSSAVSGYAGETGPARIVRVAREAGVAMVCTGSTVPSPAMGAQPVGKFLDVLRDAEAVDGGVLYETDWGLGYVPLADRTNAPVSLALDFDRRHIAATPEPADDDQRLRNRWTASRPSGSSAIVEQTTGPNGTGTAGPGIYEDSVTANVQLDSQLPDQAGWRRSLGVVDEDRWPSLAIRLHATPDLIPSWAAMPFGGRVTAANPPSQVAPDTIDAIREGWAERWDPYTWVADLNTSPFAPYRVGTLAADTGDVAETTLILTPDTLTLAADVSTTDVTWSINSSPIWTVNAESFPRYIWWEGEVVQLTNCTGGSAPQTWTVVRSINSVVKAHLANSSGHIYRPGVLVLA